MKKEFWVEFMVALMVLLFLYSAFSKISDLPSFKHAMSIQPFPVWVSSILIWALPSLEIIVSGLLAYPKTRLTGLYAFLFMMSGFTLYITAILFRLFRRVPCSCGGVIQRLGWNQHLILNLFFIAIAGLTIYIVRLLKMNHQHLKNYI